MNVLILTPDAVGSTLLQRMLTIYMQFHEFDHPVINLHELTNGVEKYYSPEFNREIVSKRAVKNWGYYQTLQQVVEVLSSVDHYKTSRLAHYHIVRRGDTLAQQIPFYNYLNENFYIIACRRSNVFEHALSMTLNNITKKLNVYDAYEKIDTFYEIYKSGVNLDASTFVSKLKAYKLYIKWSEQFFNVGSYFNYEQDIPRLEQYILELPVFLNQKKLTTWDNNFGISFNTWNKMHYVKSDLNLLSNTSKEDIEKLSFDSPADVEYYQQNVPQHWPAISSTEDFNNLPEHIKKQWTQYGFRRNGIIPFLSADKQQKLSKYTTGYSQAQNTINQMINLGIIVTGPPIKKQTLNEKTKIIKNFNQLLDLYNQWADKNPDIATAMDGQTLSNKINQESSFWDMFNNPTEVLPYQQPNSK